MLFNRHVDWKNGEVEVSDGKIGLEKKEEVFASSRENEISNVSSTFLAHRDNCVYKRSDQVHANEMKEK